METKAERYLTINQVAKMLSMTTTTIRNMMDDGRLPYKVLGKGKVKRTIRFEESKVKESMNLS